MLQRTFSILCLGILAVACNPKAPAAPPTPATVTETDSTNPLAELTGESWLPDYQEKLGKIFKYDNSGDTACYFGKTKDTRKICFEAGETEEAWVNGKHWLYSYVTNNFERETAAPGMHGWVHLLKFEIKTDKDGDRTLKLASDSGAFALANGNGTKPIINMVRINDSGEIAWIATSYIDNDDHTWLDAAIYVETPDGFKNTGNIKFNYTDDRNHQKIQRSASLFSARPTDGLPYYDILAKTIDGKTFTFHYDPATQQYAIPPEYQSLFAM